MFNNITDKQYFSKEFYYLLCYWYNWIQWTTMKNETLYLYRYRNGFLIRFPGYLKGRRKMKSEVFRASTGRAMSFVQTETMQWETMQATDFLVGDWMNATRVSQRRGAKFGGRLASLQKNHPAHQPASIL